MVQQVGADDETGRQDITREIPCMEILPNYKQDESIGIVFFADGISDRDCSIYCLPESCPQRPVLLPIDENVYKLAILNTSCIWNTFQLFLVCDANEKCTQERSSITVNMNCKKLFPPLNRAEITKELTELSQTNMVSLARNDIYAFLRRLSNIVSFSKHFNELHFVLADKSMRSIIRLLSAKDFISNYMIQDMTEIMSNMLYVSDKVIKKSTNFGVNIMENVDGLTKLLRRTRKAVFATNHIALGSLPLKKEGSSLFITFFIPQGGSIHDAKIKHSNATEAARFRIAIRKDLIVENRTEFSFLSKIKIFRPITMENTTRSGYKKIISPIIGARTKIKPLASFLWNDTKSFPVRVDFVLTASLPGKVNCAFWNVSSAQWEFSGIKLHRKNRFNFSCYSQHLTQFALLLATHPSGDDFVSSKEIVILSYILLALSCIGLGVTLVVYIQYIQQAKKSHAGNRTTSLTKVQTCRIHVSLCAALFSGHLVFLAGSHHQESDIICKGIGVLLHLFYLHTFAWSLVEGVNIILSFVRIARDNNFLTDVPQFFLKASLMAWGIPAVIVAVTLGVSITNYGLTMETADHGFRGLCFLKPNPFYIAFFTPVVLSFVINAVIFGATIKTLKTYNRARNNSSKVKKELKGFLSIFVLLNLTWLLGLLQIGAARQVFMYLFVIINGLQGVLVFLFYCILRKDIRRFIIGRYFHKHLDISTTRTSTTQNRSTATHQVGSMNLVAIASPTETQQQTTSLS